MLRKSISVEKVENGWLLEWMDESLKEQDYDQITSGYRKTRMLFSTEYTGKEIFTSRKSLMKRIGELI